MQITLGDNLEQRMTALAESFPALKGAPSDGGVLSDGGAPGVSPWEPLRFIKWARGGGLSHGEKMAAYFVLMVWNNLDWGDEFNLAEAISVWDRGNYRAFQEWVNHPWWA